MKHGSRTACKRGSRLPADWMQKPSDGATPAESLFRSALSFEEYSDTGTLKKRLRTLAKALRVGAQQQKRNADETEPGDNSGAQTTGPRSRPCCRGRSTSDSDAAATGRRRRRAH